MKIKLKNFRCYLDKEFDFGENGLLLLSGPSGCGKSTILMGIMFALYGTGTKLISFGKTSLQVQMELEELHILRTKKPNRLLVTNTKIGIELEDEAGQAVINEKFGTAFDCTSYIQQNTLNSFIMMSPLEKLEFLEKFAFNGIDLGLLKGRCQAIIKKRNEELISTTSQLELSLTYFKSLNKPGKVSFPIRTKEKENAVKNETIRLKNTRVLIKRVEKAIHSFSDELTDTKIFTSQYGTKKETLLSFKDKIEDNECEKGTTHYEGDEKLEKYESELKLILSGKELSLLQERYEEDKVRLEKMEENEKETLESEIKFIKEILWKEYSSTEVNKNIAEYTQLFHDSEKLKVLKQNKERYKVDEEKITENIKTLEKERKKLTQNKDKLSKLILQQELYKCPACHVSLRFQDDNLHLFQDDISDNETNMEEVKKDISTCTKLVNRLEYIILEETTNLKRYNETLEEITILEQQYEEEMQTKEETESSIEYLKEYKRTQTELEKKCKKLEANLKDKKFSSSLETFKHQLSNQKEKIKNISKQEKPTLNLDENELRHQIQTQRQSREKILRYEKNLKDLTRELKKITDQIQEMETEFNLKYPTLRNIEIVQGELNAKTKELSILKLNCEKHEENMRQIERYAKYKEELTRYNEWEIKVKELKELEEKNRKQYAASTLLKDKILEAESIAILNIINSINIHAQEYLDIFFPNDPIVVRLLSFKQTKKKTSKPQVNLEIDYKGMEADVSMLSGGELARVVLSYTLALAEIFNSPLLMLDESTASLDQDMTSIVMDGIRKNFGNKLTVVIAHQVISGDFDRQINL